MIPSPFAASNTTLSPPKRKRGRPPKKTPIDTQMMTTTPHVSVGSSMPERLSQAAYSFQFDSNESSPVSPRKKAPIRPRRTVSASASIASQPPQPSQQLPSSPLHPVTPQRQPQMLHHPQTTPLHSAAASTPLYAVPMTAIPTASSDLGLFHDGLGIDLADRSVNPHMLFDSMTTTTTAADVLQPAFDPQAYYLSGGDLSNIQFMSSPGPMPAERTAFSEIVQSSPLYPGYCSVSPVNNNYAFDERPRAIASEDTENINPLDTSAMAKPPKTLAPAAKVTETRPLEDRSIESLANQSTHRAISERRNASSLSLKPVSFRRNTTIFTGPLTAPVEMVKSRSFIKRRVSLNVSDHGRAVVEQQEDEVAEPMCRKYSRIDPATTMQRGHTSSGYLQRRHTIYDQSIDYINDDARRTSLESLFPELSPVQPASASMCSSSTASLTWSSNPNSDSEESIEWNHSTIEDSDVEEVEPEDDKDDHDARLALKKALERNATAKPLDTQLYSTSFANLHDYALTTGPLIY
ncbi:hypothetical protein TRVA0_001S04346 [Trichomonascus vanleenenianus]|uniref:Sum1p n=1 Tax=Trichomonascus vanleenenianus TaxID=2268995 RepID=UPI003EC9D76F